METVLVDTSVWINVFKGIETKASVFLRDSNDILVATCPTVVQEVLQGIVSDDEYLNISDYLNNVINLPSNGYNYAREAAALYRQLRKKGINIRKPNDCLIAVYAIKNDISILHDDKDFTSIASCSELKNIQV